MMSGKRWGYVVQFFCLLVLFGYVPISDKDGWGKNKECFI